MTTVEQIIKTIINKGVYFFSDFNDDNISAVEEALNLMAINYREGSQTGNDFYIRIMK